MHDYCILDYPSNRTFYSVQYLIVILLDISISN